MSEIMPAFIVGGKVEELADLRPQCGNGAFGGSPQQRALSLAKSSSIGLRSGEEGGR